MNQSERKTVRLKGHDYSSAGVYFITVCVKDKAELLSHITLSKDEISVPKNELLWHGEVAEKYIRQMSDFYDDIKIEKYIIMPNHIHFLVRIYATDEEAVGKNVQHSLIAKLIGTFKRFCNREYGENIWQRSSHDHVVRNDEEYAKVWNYIEYNALKWQQDRYYIK